MCVGALLGGGRQPSVGAPPQRQTVAPTVKSAAPQAEYLEPEKIKEKTGDDEKVDTKKKKALEVKKVKEGVKEFSSIDEKSMPQGPEGGVNI